MSADPWNAGPYHTQNEEILAMSSGYTPEERQAKAKTPRDNYDMEKGGVKLDAGKVRLDLVPPEANIAEAAVYTYGAVKYDDWNWAKGMRRGRIMAALMRHWIAYMVGEELDDESGLPHLWHMGACVCMLVSAELRGVAEEDRREAVDAYYMAKSIFAGMRNPKP